VAPEIDKSITTPGIHPQFVQSRFDDRTQRLIKRLASQWYVTWSGEHLRLAASHYDYFLIKPTPMFSEMFNIERELIVVLSPYQRFEPRSLDAFDAAENRLADLRVESVCRILISEDPDIEKKVTNLLKTDPEQPIVIPFTFDELCSSYDDFFVRNRFRKHFYTRDLFSFLSPLRKDLYFFGRSELLQTIISKHRSGEHSGIFGLRKSGKTSIVYAIERHMAAHDGEVLSIDCENPSIHGCRWYELLEKIVNEYKALRKSNYHIKSNDRYTDKLAADSFTEDMLKIHRFKKPKPLLILFDEIERISPTTGSSEHWRDDTDFIFFWQTLRAFYQRNQQVLTYILVGTNPSCVEQPMIMGHDNPLFASIQPTYVPPFTIHQTREMVRKLGRYMGLSFDELLYAKFVEDFGGHPFLIRQFCSIVHQICPGDRPARVDRALYDKVMHKFTESQESYLEMIVNVLRDWYQDEYDMLRFLAQGDHSTFSQFATDHSSFTRHLIGYGLITQSPHGYTFNIETLRDYLENLHRYERQNMTDDEKVAEISDRRNKIEKLLRVALRNTLRAALGRKAAGEVVIKSIHENRRRSFATSDIDVLLAKHSSPLFFDELISIVMRKWDDHLKNIFEMDKRRAEFILKEINECGRPDAHAKYVDGDEFTQLRLHFKKLESVLEDWS